MKITKYCTLFLFMSTAGIAIEQPVSILSPAIKTQIAIPYPTTLCYTSQGTLLAGTSNSALFICRPDAQDPSKRIVKIAVQDYVGSLDSDPQHNNLVALQDASDEISIYDIEKLVKVDQITNAACSLEYNNDGNQLLVTTNKNNCNLVDVRSKNITALTTDATVNAAIYNPAANNSIAIVRNMTNNPFSIQLFDIRTRKAVHTITSETSINDVAFTSDGSKMMISSTGDFKLVNTKTGLLTAFYTLQGKKTRTQPHNKQLLSTDIAFIPGQDIFLASNWNGSFILADVSHPKYHGTFEIPENQRYPDFYPFAITHDGKDMAVSLTEDFHIYIYDVSGLKDKLKSNTKPSTARNRYCSVS